MKLKLLFLFLFLSQSISFAQCPPDYVVLTSQSEVDNFGVQYPNCEAIQGFLVILGNDIADLSPLSQINSVGSISISDTSLTTMQGLDALTLTGLSGEDAFIVFDNNPMLQNVLFLNNYTINIPVVFLIRDMSSLTSLEGAGNVSEFITIYLENNDVLSDLNGLSESLNITGGIQNAFLHISGNEILSDISRLNTAQWNAALTCEISNNSQLAVCDNALVCDRMDNSSCTISNNALGCNSNSEVEIACQNLSVNNTENNSFRIYPNPTSGVIFIDGLDPDKLEYVEVYSSDGKKMFETYSARFDISNLQSGIYFLEITTSQGLLTKRFIKE